MHYLDKMLSEDEKIVLRLYHESDSVTFSKFDCTQEEAFNFAGLISEPEYSKNKSGEVKWYASKKKKMNVAGFLKDEEKAPSEVTEEGQM